MLSDEVKKAVREALIRENKIAKAGAVEAIRRGEWDHTAAFQDGFAGAAAALSVRASASPEKMLGELDDAGFGTMRMATAAKALRSAITTLTEERDAALHLNCDYEEVAQAQRLATDAEIAQLKSQRDAMREALKPFVEAGSALADSIYPGVTKAKILVDIADIGQARAAIAQGEPR